jgi:hypothetical protein
MREIELRVQRVSQVELHRQFPASQLLDEFTKTSLIACSWNPNGKLAAKVRRCLSLQTRNGFVIDTLIVRAICKKLRQIFLRKPLHSDKQATWRSAITLPCLYHIIDVPPATKIEIANTEVATPSNL